MRQAELAKEQKMSVPRWSAVEAYHMAGYAQRRFRGPDRQQPVRTPYMLYTILYCIRR